jgi:hypothetical protein
MPEHTSQECYQERKKAEREGREPAEWAKMKTNAKVSIGKFSPYLGRIVADENDMKEHATLARRAQDENRRRNAGVVPRRVFATEEERKNAQRETKKKYKKTEKGQAAKDRYVKSEKGREASLRGQMKYYHKEMGTEAGRAKINEKAKLHIARRATRNLDHIVQEAQADETKGQRFDENVVPFAGYKRRGAVPEPVRAPFPSKENRKF